MNLETLKKENLKRLPSQLINQDSGIYEYYTDTEIVDAAAMLMGGIDLDPASSIEANKRVKALEFMTVDDDGLSKEWKGKVWMNHPFSRANNPLWINKLVQEYRSGRVKQACCICFAATSEKWFQPLAKFPQCYLSPRTNYYLPDGSKKTGVTKGSVVTYMGRNVIAFDYFFKQFGTIKVEYKR